MGPRWVLSRCLYAAKLRSGWLRWRFPCRPWSDHPADVFADFAAPWPRAPFPGGGARALRDADALLAGTLTCFSRHAVRGSFPPDWFRNPFSAAAAAGPPDLRHWSLIPDFAGADIKGVWEASRFGFAFTLARAFAVTQDARLAEAFWRAVEDWRDRNPPHRGPNWKCGQEASLRLIAWVFGFHAVRTSPASTPERCATLAEMVRVTAERIEGNLAYALSQKNNHGISEAAGLFTAGIVLGRPAWTRSGRLLLERQARELIYGDGSFSQHSTNYHRLMLHDLLWAWALGRANGVEFSHSLGERLRRAGEWLLGMLEPATGRVPNLGSNDGALVLPLTDCGYLDYRPTVQAVGLAVDGSPWLAAGPWDELAYWLGLRVTSEPRPASCGGGVSLGAAHPCSENDRVPCASCVVLRHPGGRLVFRCPGRFRHRPAHCDLLHVDLWHGGVNLLRDGGTYSYHCEAPWDEYFPGTAAHNTVQFDGRDQMPRLSRFLYGRWPTLHVQTGADGDLPWVCAEYRDWLGGNHRRRVERTPAGYRVRDEVDGYAQQAVLRWRLAPELEWRRRGDAWESPAGTLRVSAIPGPVTLEQTVGWESLYYMERTGLPVIEAAVPAGPHPQVLTTEIVLRAV